MTSTASQAVVQRLWSYRYLLRDASLENADSLPEPDVLARGIVEDLRVALAQFAAITDDMGANADALDLAKEE